MTVLLAVLFESVCFDVTLLWDCTMMVLLPCFYCVILLLTAGSKRKRTEAVPGLGVTCAMFGATLTNTALSGQNAVAFRDELKRSQVKPCCTPRTRALQWCSRSVGECVNVWSVVAGIGIACHVPALTFTGRRLRSSCWRPDCPRPALRPCCLLSC